MKHVCSFVLALSFFLTLPALVRAQTPTYHVVVGAFQVEQNAAHLTAKVNQEGLTARYLRNEAKGLFYVVVFQSRESKPAFAEVMRVRAQTSFTDAWVFRGQLGEPSPTVPEVTQPAEEPQRPVEQGVAVVEPEETKEEPTEPIVEERPQQEPVTEEVVETKPKPAGKPFFFRMTSEATGNTVVGEVHILESAKATQYQSYKSNEVVYLPAPQNRLGTYQVVTLAAGYKEMKRTINYADPAASAAEVGPAQEFVISLPLVRVKMGDYIEFSNVRFFPNSAILQPESQNELDGLVQLLKENPKYKVKVHGHCNGEGNRDIVSKGNSTEFFATHTDNLRENASAKRLTQLRADIVKEYLVSQGIESKRVEAKGEGGKYIIYPKTSTLASRNDRVEVEVKKGR